VLSYLPRASTISFPALATSNNLRARSLPYLPVLLFLIACNPPPPVVSTPVGGTGVVSERSIDIATGRNSALTSFPKSGAGESALHQKPIEVQ
jgi:hypothetical protein